MTVQTLRRRTPSIFRYRLVGSQLVVALGLALRERRHRGAGGAGGDRRLALLIAAAEADVGKALQQGKAALVWMLFLRLTAGLANFGLSRHRQILEFRHAGRTGCRGALGCWRDEGLGHHRFRVLAPRRVVIWE